jgi:hypothetical protein
MAFGWNEISCLAGAKNEIAAGHLNTCWKILSRFGSFNDR